MLSHLLQLLIRQIITDNGMVNYMLLFPLFLSNTIIIIIECGSRRGIPDENTLLYTVKSEASFNLPHSCKIQSISFFFITKQHLYTILSSHNPGCISSSNCSNAQRNLVYYIIIIIMYLYSASIQ